MAEQCNLINTSNKSLIGDHKRKQKPIEHNSKILNCAKDTDKPKDRNKKVITIGAKIRSLTKGIYKQHQ